VGLLGLVAVAWAIRRGLYAGQGDAIMSAGSEGIDVHKEIRR
jgi:hypothetical protein